MVSYNSMNSTVFLLAYRKQPCGDWRIVDNPFLTDQNQPLSGEFIASRWYKSILNCNESVEYIIFEITKAELNKIIINEDERAALIDNITTSLGCCESEMIVMRHTIDTAYINSIVPKLEASMTRKNNPTSTINTTMTNRYGEFSMTFMLDKEGNIHLYCPRFKANI